MIQEELKIRKKITDPKNEKNLQRRKINEIDRLKKKDIYVGINKYLGFNVMNKFTLNQCKTKILTNQKNSSNEMYHLTIVFVRLLLTRQPFHYLMYENETKEHFYLLSQRRYL